MLQEFYRLWQPLNMGMHHAIHKGSFILVKQLQEIQLLMVMSGKYCMDTGTCPPDMNCWHNVLISLKSDQGQTMMRLQAGAGLHL